jgi:hypothetical protein
MVVSLTTYWFAWCVLSSKRTHLQVYIFVQTPSILVSILRHIKASVAITSFVLYVAFPVGKAKTSYIPSSNPFLCLRRIKSITHSRTFCRMTLMHVLMFEQVPELLGNCNWRVVRDV